MSGVLRRNRCETCRNILQKAPMKTFINKDSLRRPMLFSERLQQLLMDKRNI